MTESIHRIFADELRLDALKKYDIINTLPESEFDDITKLIALIFDVPIVIISFMDDKKQYFKSHYGTDLSENLIENSFCKDIIRDKDTLTIIPDARLDKRFSENPFVTNNPGLLFYAGFPLIDSEDHFLGSICLYDTKSNNLNEKEKASLTLLGRQVVKLLEDRKSKNLFQLETTKLDLERQKFEAAIQIADLGTWEWNVENNTIKYSDNWAEMLGYKLSELEPVSFQTWVDLVHPDDLDMASEMIHKKLILGENILNIEFRMRHKSGDYLWIRSKGDIIQKDAQGNTLKAFGTHLNINEQKIGEVYVKKIQENIDAAIFRYVQYSSGKDKLLFYTKKLHQLYNIPEDQNLDGDNVKLVWAKIYPEDIPVIQKTIENSKKKSKNFKAEWRVIHNNSTVKWLRAHGTIVLNNNEETIWDIILTDVTDEKTKSKNLQNLNDRLKYAQKVSKLGYMSQNLENDVLYWSDEIYTILEYDHKHITPSIENYFDRIHPDDTQNVLHSKKQSEENDSTISTEHRVILPNGNTKWVVYTTSGTTTSSLGERIRECTVQDITEQKLMHISIEKSNNRFKLVGKATSDLIWDWDILNDTIIWGDNYSTNFEYIFKNLDETKDKFLRKFMHNNDKLRVFNSLEATFNSDEDLWQSEYRLKSVTDSWFEISNTAYILRDHSNKPVRMVGAIRDISLKKERERNLISLNKSLKIQAQKLEISNSELEQFAYVASHDLQEPLRMITSFLTLLEKKYDNILDEKGKRYIHFAVDGALRMRKIILDLLDYSRVGKENVELKMVDLNILMDEVLAIKRKAISDTNAEITWNELPKINTYYAPLFQVFTNLISNAIKYQKPNNKPVITISCKDIETHWEFSIQDNGIGIRPEYYEKIFIIFQRLHNKEQYAGTGIGLAITKKIINNLGGNIWVEETEIPGTLFKFSVKK